MVNKTAESYRIVKKCVDETIENYLPGPLRQTLGLSGETETYIKDNLYRLVLTDAIEFAGRDPASAGSVFMIQHAYSGFRATVAYRLSHQLYILPKGMIEEEISLQSYARKISEDVKRDFRVEIHPGAKIGPGLILDHARGIVVGETSIIGKNCCLLQGVVLGALSVNSSLPHAERRHPSLGNNVTVCGNALLLGPISIGNDVLIGANAIVRDNVPDNVSVTMHAYVQYSKHSSSAPRNSAIAAAPKLFGIVPDSICYDSFIIYGTGLASIAKATLVNSSVNSNDVGIILDIKEREDHKLLLTVTEFSFTVVPELWLELAFGDLMPPILVRYHEGLRYFLEQLSAGRG